MGEHTPGPWEHKDGTIIADGWLRVADLWTCNPNDPSIDIVACEAECDANARLIAAAPDLLEACRQLLLTNSVLVGIAKAKATGQCALCAGDWLMDDFEHGTRCAVVLARAAVRKAKGGS